MAAPNTRQLLDLLMTVPAKDYKNALAYVMSEWVMHQGQFLFTSSLSFSLSLACAYQNNAEIGEVFWRETLCESLWNLKQREFFNRGDTGCISN